MDKLTRQQRSDLMAKVKGRNTTPERAVSEALRSARYRYTQHDKTLPGTPDFVLPRHALAIFVHGCFWHSHSCKRGRSMPATNRAFWKAKKAANITRDRRAKTALRRLGYGVLVLWECRLKGRGMVASTIRAAVASGQA